MFRAARRCFAQLGLVASLNRPGGNVTGVTFLAQEAVPKLLESLRELLPTARVIALLGALTKKKPRCRG